MNRGRESLEYVLQAIERIEVYARIGEAAFLRESLTQDGIIRQLEIIGEAIKRLSPEIRAQNPVVPWHGFAGMWDVLIHSFDKVDLSEVGNTVQVDIPVLKAQVTTILYAISVTEA